MRQSPGVDANIKALQLRPCGTIVQYARRAAAEADAASQRDGNSAARSVIEAAATVAVQAGGQAYEAGELARSSLRLPQYLLMRVGPFADVWEQVARAQLAKGDETAALVAGERGSVLNPGWGCAMWLQSQLMHALGRAEERRDLALGALESPFWTLDATVSEVMAAAQLSHIEDVRALVRTMEDKVREQQGAPPRTRQELALLRALDAMDAVVRTEGAWDSVRPEVAEALAEAGLMDAARIAATEV